MTVGRKRKKEKTIKRRLLLLFSFDIFKTKEARVVSKVDMLLISCLASLFLARLYCDLLLSCSQAVLKSNVELVRHVFNSASWGEIAVQAILLLFSSSSSFVITFVFALLSTKGGKRGTESHHVAHEQRRHITVSMDKKETRATATSLIRSIQ